MPIPTTAREHPDVWTDLMAISAVSLEHTIALTKLAVVADSLFDGPGVPLWVGATTRLIDVCARIPGQVDPTYYSEPFWGIGDRGVVAAFCETAIGRPVLMALVPFNGPGPSDPADEVAAKLEALRRARSRKKDL